MRVKIHRKSSFAPSSEALYGVSYRPKLRGQWVPVLRLFAEVCKLELPLPGFKSSVSRRRVC